MKNIGLVVPPNLGWLQIELDKKEINYLWELVKNKKDNTKHKLVGHIDSSYTIVDKGNWFFDNVLKYCIQTYSKHFGDLGEEVASAIELGVNKRFLLSIDSEQNPHALNRFRTHLF